MDTTSRRGIKEQDETAVELKTRQREARLLAVNRLRENPDFQVLKDFLRDVIDTHRRDLNRILVTPQDLALHNFNHGIIHGLEFALTGTEKIESAVLPPT